MVRLRDAGYCNLKLLLIFLVIYGHWIEPWIRSDRLLMDQYRLIYLVHMPLFAFLSGLFLTGEAGCARSMKRTVPTYLVWQTAAVVLGAGMVRWHTPWWHLWYLLSLIFWTGIAWLWYRFGRGRGGWLILILSVAAGCLCGYLPWLDRMLSGSRTVVFFPCFWLGVMTPPDISRERLRIPSLVVLAAMGGVIAWVWNRTGVVFLYHAAPFGRMEQGWLLRLGCYGAGFALGLAMLAWVPGKRFAFTRMGADTMMYYLLHGPVVAVLRLKELPAWGYPVGTAVLLCVLDLLSRWRSGMYGIVPGERRCFPWRPLKKSTKNTENSSTGSYCP